MKTCAYCGRENPDAATLCIECGTDEFKTPGQTPPLKLRDLFEFTPLSADDVDKDWVTLLRCPTLAEADAVAAHLDGAGIPAFIPDQFAMQAGSFSLSYGFVRVQVPPEHFERAKEVLSTSAVAEPPPPPPLAST